MAYKKLQEIDELLEAIVETAATGRQIALENPQLATALFADMRGDALDARRVIAEIKNLREEG